MQSSHQASTGQDGFAITASDTVDIKDDVANYTGAEFVYLHNPTATGGTVRVMPAGKKNISGFTLTGTSGTANITVNGTAYLATFSSTLTVTATNFVSSWGKTLKERGIRVRSTGAVLIFEGVNQATLTIANVSGNLSGTALAQTPLTIYVNAGDVFPLAVSRVYATTPTPPAGIIGLLSYSK